MYLVYNFEQFYAWMTNKMLSGCR